MMMNVVAEMVLGGSALVIIATAVVFGFFPVVIAKGLSRVFPKGDARRDEMAAEVYKVKYVDRVNWLADQFGRVVVEGLPSRVRSWRRKGSVGQSLVGGESLAGPLLISVPESRATTELIASLSDVLIKHRGDHEVRLRLVRGGNARMFEIPYPVAITGDLYGELHALLGHDCLA